MVRVKAMPPAKAAQDYLAWCQEARERYDERVAMWSDGGPVTPEIDWAARFDARHLHVHTVSRLASSRDAVSFAMGSV